MVRILAALIVLAACGSQVHNGNGDDDANSGACSSSTCSGVCVTGLGCVACDPAAGNTCNGNTVVTCNTDGTFGGTVQACGQGMACGGGTCSNACTADGVDLVYVVDEQNDFMSFDPRKLPGDPLTIIGTLACPHNGTSIQNPPGAAMPFSMSVDRDGVAWVLYTTGELFNVSLQTAACTKANNTVNASNMALFGMGFVTDTPGGNTEKLFLAGGGNAAQANGRLAWDDPKNGNLTPTVVGTLTAPSSYSAELTGTSEAKLYGFYPVLNTPAYVQEIDRTTGMPPAGATKWNLGTAGLGNGVTDWAFAQWGGVFYIFVTTQDINGIRNSTIRAIDRATSQYTVISQNLTFFIDGAGVSTCAPIVIQ